jgi:hypothetical protein
MLLAASQLTIAAPEYDMVSETRSNAADADRFMTSE